MTAVIKIGTRGSPLALAQAYEVRDRLQESTPDIAIEIVEIKTTGDKIQDRPLSEVGGKGLFSKELDEALRDRRIDLAVHSMKDLETWLPEDQVIAAVLPREDVRDAFISPKAGSLDALPDGAIVGTSSLRRQAQILHRRPDLKVVTFRGNVQTRLRKLNEGVADATLLAMAGLNRLGRADIATAPLEPEVLLPAAAQGAIGITIRKDDAALMETLQPLNHAESALRVTVERALLAKLDGSCRTPIGALVDLLDGGRLRLRGLLATEDGTVCKFTERTGPREDGEAMARDAGEELRRAVGDDV